MCAGHRGGRRLKTRGDGKSTIRAAGINPEHETVAPLHVCTVYRTVLRSNDLSATAIRKLRSKYGKRRKIQRERRKRNFEHHQVDILDPAFGLELFVKLEFVSVSRPRIFMKMYILCINVDAQIYRIQ